jgi:CDP-glucose 4,6-dehydratase
METLVKENLLSFFERKKILITGHTGFKGSWLSYLLQYYGAEVTGYALPPETSPNLYTELNLEAKIHSIFGNVNDFENICQIINDFEPGYIFHLAAQPLVRRSYADTLNTFNTNVQGTANILESCKSLKKKCIVICVTTDKVYRNLEIDYPYKETDELGGHDPYSASKAAAELVISSYRSSFFYDVKSVIKVASVRAGNVIGGGDWSADRLIPDIIRGIKNDENILLRNPDAIRPWQHVMDPIIGYLFLAKTINQNSQEFCEAWNFGPQNDEILKVGEVASRVAQIFGKGRIVVDKLKDAPHESNLLRLDISKATDKLNWTPTWSAKQALEKTANWYKDYFSGVMAETLVLRDIKEFIQKNAEL